ncbi:MAG: hypothetical protein HC942_02530 [Microcoleus sp. SU_5_6]|nr:hypothetical protein [Microcoleus sp. SU_5_6]
MGEAFGYVNSGVFHNILARMLGLYDDFPSNKDRPSTINYQLSTVNCQLSTVNCQLSTVNYQLSTINFLS